MIRKAYVWKWEKPKKSTDYSYDYYFCEFEKDAASWTTRESAQHACDEMNRGVKIEADDGGTFICQEFIVEETTPERFVISAEGPFRYPPKDSR
jgi:hypothetical protein